MANEPTDFRQRLFDAQEMNPTLHEAYRKELDSILNETHTPKSRIGGIALLVICVAVVVGEIRALMVYHAGPVFYVGADHDAGGLRARLPRGSSAICRGAEVFANNPSKWPIFSTWQLRS